MSDIEQLYADWRRTHRALTQAEHQAINNAYPGATLEYCCECGNPTGRAGRGNGSLYSDDGEGPLCDECWEDRGEQL